MLIIETPGSGKSHLIKYLIHEICSNYSVEYSTVCSATAKLNGEYDFIDLKYVHTDWSDDFCEAIIKQQSSGKPAFLVLDDVIGNVQFNSKVFKKLAADYRHFNLRIIVVIQYLNSVIPPVVKNCIKAVTWFRQKQELTIKVIYSLFDLDFGNPSEFQDHMLALRKHQFVLHQPNETIEDREEAYKVLKAPEIPEFSFVF